MAGVRFCTLLAKRISSPRIPMSWCLIIVTAYHIKDEREWDLLHWTRRVTMDIRNPTVTCEKNIEPRNSRLHRVNREKFSARKMLSSAWTLFGLGSSSGQALRLEKWSFGEVAFRCPQNRAMLDRSAAAERALPNKLRTHIEA